MKRLTSIFFELKWPAVLYHTASQFQDLLAPFWENQLVARDEKANRLLYGNEPTNRFISSG